MIRNVFLSVIMIFCISCESALINSESAFQFEELSDDVNVNRKKVLSYTEEYIIRGRLKLPNDYTIYGTITSCDSNSSWYFKVSPNINASHERNSDNCNKILVKNYQSQYFVGDDRAIGYVVILDFIN